MRKKVDAFDRLIGRVIGSLPDWFDLPMRFFTLLGQPPFTMGIGVISVVYGTQNDDVAYVTAGVIVVITLIVNGLLKLFMRRRRPTSDYVSQMMFKTFSFPSGHATGAVISYGLVALVLATQWPMYELAIWFTFAVVAFSIGLSRIYLKAHYASDVIGGWIVGLVALAVLFVAV